MEELLARIDAAPGEELPIDTEADSFHHYFEKVCLFQIATGGAAFLVDPLAPGLSLAPLFARLAERTLLLHGADYDLRLLYRGYGFRAREVFDTMIAAQLLGEKELGLSALLTKRLSITLDKAHQRADWSERPLSADMRAYAAADVLYLPALVAALREELALKDRLEWHREECARLVAIEMRPAEDDPENDWRIKGANGLSSKERAFLKAFWTVREERAKELDRPPFRVLTNDKLIHGTRLAAKGERDIALVFPGPRPLPSSFARALREALEAARAQPPADWPGMKRGEKAEADPQLERAVDALRKKRDAAALALGMDPVVVAPKAAVAALARAQLRRGNDGASPATLAAESGVSRWRAEILLST